MYAPLSASYQWNQLNSNNALTNKIQTLIQEGEHVTLNRIPTTVLKLKNKLKSPITTELLEAIQNGDLVLIYKPDTKVPTYLPFVITRPRPNSCVGVVFLNNLDASVAGDELFLNERKFKVAIESCYISMQIANAGESPKLRSTALIRSGSLIYSNIMVSAINRKHNIKLEPVMYNSVIYLMSRYYVGTILGCNGTMDPEIMQNYCLYNCKQTDYISLKKIVEQFEDSDFDNIAKLISKLSTIEELQKRLSNLTVSNFIESYINMYDASMLLAMENFNYFLYNILSVNETTYVNNYQMLKNIVGDEGRKIYADLIVSFCKR